MNKTNLKVLAMATVMLLFGCAFMNAQVTVGASTPPNATLDVVATHTDGSSPEGVIAPRLTLAQLKSADGVYSTDQNGAIVYVTDVIGGTSTKTANITAAGYYYYDAVNSVWKGFGGGGITTNVIVEHLTGNSFAQSVFSAQQTVIVHFGATTSTLTLPDLTSADKGKTVIISNRGSSGVIQANLTLLDTSSGSPYTTTLPANVPINRSRALMWVGNAWIEMAQ